MIEYQKKVDITHEALLHLYESVGWSAYTQDNPDLTSLLEGAKHYLTAWDGERLIGLIRVVGDGVYIAYIQDVLVHPDYQKQGIGKYLMQKMLKEIRYAKQIILTTENSPATKAFYQSLGMKEFNETGALGFSM
ncbi:GNAT family N-acetyltransferase [Aerococcaceae bacterium INB8]|uniref:GNAT family N-acetyltransferase n=1 Tax=Ruoffia halotolerans TaxID=2748684 RepID=A0A839A7I5_9LACT|nr:GNAT family N-acetyltransferase [Ruoffia halotolerans]MBA5729774.1 GNAT family N-acetyltransferase [Ruoffia halotolerans]